MKVFGIGLSKTGTQSLAAALRILGLSTIHYPWNWNDILRHDAACDIPVITHFEFLYKVFPDSKFILTTRDISLWLESCEKHFSPNNQKELFRSKPVEEWEPRDFHIADIEQRVYGTWMYDESLFRTAYVQHTQYILDFFASRDRNRLLIIDLTSNKDAWKELTEFLDMDAIPFPWENRA
jgi:hypothetical protein